MVIIKSYTDIEQSKKLAKILPIESADMVLPFRHTKNDEYIPGYVASRNYAEVYNEMMKLPGMGKEDVCQLIQPAWSLAALLDVLPDDCGIDKEDGKYVGYAVSDECGTYTSDNPVDACVSMIEYLHEVKESEDEKIRKEIIEIFKSAQRDGICEPIKNEQFEKIFAWLEKQGEKIDAIENFDTEFEKQVSCLIASSINKEHEYNEGFVKWTANALLNYAKHELEKQGKQKPDDKVEPKFKKGDWITNGACIIQITSVDDRYYWHDNNCIGGDIESIDKEYHLWTIQDAKDGDVLATDSWLYIFKYTNNKNLIQFHCNCPINEKPYKWSFLSDDCYLDIYINANIHPATKEQCDLLFQKMHEAGYEWDAEKKELKKIEQNPAWSEEDERMLDNTLSTIRYALSIPIDHEDDPCLVGSSTISWLKSLKERYTWKPSDEQMKFLWKYAEQNNYDGAILTSLFHDLKKLKEE